MQAEAQPSAPGWRAIPSPQKRRRRPERLPNLFECALLLLDDECPPERCMQLCGMEEDATEDACRRCWKQYLYYVANGRSLDPYHNERVHEGGMKP